jgi:hypothetical protein
MLFLRVSILIQHTQVSYWPVNWQINGHDGDDFVRTHLLHSLFTAYVQVMVPSDQRAQTGSRVSQMPHTK